MNLGLHGKTAVVAGGSRGCGRGISEVLAAEGATVVFSGRQHEPVTATEATIRAGGGQTVGVSCSDVSALRAGDTSAAVVVMEIIPSH